jgi:8-oxo-dGTP diphosphatase
MAGMTQAPHHGRGGRFIALSTPLAYTRFQAGSLERSLIAMAVSNRGSELEAPAAVKSHHRQSSSEALHPRPVRNVGGSVQPTVDVRVVLFTVTDGLLLVALEKNGAGWRLPRGLPAVGEPLDAAARRIIRQTTGLQEQYLEQLYTLSLDQPAAWTVIVGYIALLCSAQRPADVGSAVWHDSSALPRLAEADRMVIDYALVRLRAKIGYTNIAFHLLPEIFSLTELQGAYETILGRRLDKRNFRRRVIASGILEATSAKRRDGSHRPATLYRFRAEHDPATYLTPPWADGN